MAVIVVIQLKTFIPQLRKGLFDNLNIGMEANIPAHNGILSCLALTRRYTICAVNKDYPYDKKIVLFSLE
jgi:hypothetical protein